MDLEEKIKSGYYKEVTNGNIEDQNYLFVFKSVKRKITISKIRTNSHEIHSETRHWPIPKMSWDKRVLCLLCDTKTIEYQKKFLSSVYLIPKLNFNFKIFFILPPFLTF
jgi:hypothetical protein